MERSTGTGSGGRRNICCNGMEMGGLRSRLGEGEKADAEGLKARMRKNHERLEGRAPADLMGRSWRNQGSGRRRSGREGARLKGAKALLLKMIGARARANLRWRINKFRPCRGRGWPEARAEAQPSSSGGKEAWPRRCWAVETLGRRAPRCVEEGAGRWHDCWGRSGADGGPGRSVGASG